jgi:pimeloyl-ACP methyl ester carboxylesterase
MPPNHDIYCLSGILQWPEDQFRPLLEVISKVGVFCPVHYRGDHFHLETTMESTVLDIFTSLNSGRRVTLIGASFGGMVIPWLLQRLRDGFGIDPSRVRVIIVDAPTGAETMKELPTWAAPLVSWLTQFRLSPQINAGLGAFVLSKMVKGPRSENIAVPEDVEDEAAYKQSVINEALTGLMGHKFTMYWSQLGWMSGRGGRELPYHILDGIDATYVACIGPNETVRQPLAVDAWQAHVYSIVEMDTAHCAFLEQKPAFVELFRELLDT